MQAILPEPDENDPGLQIVQDVALNNADANPLEQGMQEVAPSMSE